MLTKSQKSKIVEELADKFGKQKIAIFSDFHGINVVKARDLRRALKKDYAEYKVAKKTLIDRAIVEQGLQFSAKELQGEVGVAFGYGDQVAPAKALVKFSKENETFKILGGIMEGRILSIKDIVALAKLPSREILLAQVVGAFQAPLRGLATVLQANIRNLATVLNKIKEKK